MAADATMTGNANVINANATRELNAKATHAISPKQATAKHNGAEIALRYS